MMWQIESGVPQNPVYFFGVGPDYVTAGAGMMSFEKTTITNWRTMLDLDTDRMLGILTGLKTAGFAFREPALKRVPPPYDKDHAAASFLRMKAVVASRPVTPDTPLNQILTDTFTNLWPLNNLLISIAEA